MKNQKKKYKYMALSSKKTKKSLRQPTEEMLREQYKEQQIIFDSVPAWIFYKDRENRFIRVNKAFSEVMQMSKEELEGKSLFDIYPKEQAEIYWKDDKEVMESGNPKRNIIEPMESPKGTFWLRTDKIPYRNDQGDIIGVICFVIDITESKKAEEKIKELAESLEGKVRERTKELQERVEELKMFHRLTVGRELEMIKLKEKIKELDEKLKEKS